MTTNDSEDNQTGGEPCANQTASVPTPDSAPAIHTEAPSKAAQAGSEPPLGAATPTPRTNAVQWKTDSDEWIVDRDFARILERELAEALTYGKDAKEIALKWHDQLTAANAAREAAERERDEMLNTAKTTDSGQPTIFGVLFNTAVAERDSLQARLEKAAADLAEVRSELSNERDDFATERIDAALAINRVGIERDTALADLTQARATIGELESFLALVMHNFDGMARGQLWQQYRTAFPGLHERAIDAALAKVPQE